MEHIICSQIRSHLDEHEILSPFEHGFRGKHFEFQFTVTYQDLARLYDHKVKLTSAYSTLVRPYMRSHTAGLCTSYNFMAYMRSHVTGFSIFSLDFTGKSCSMRCSQRRRVWILTLHRAQC